MEDGNFYVIRKLFNFPKLYSYDDALKAAVIQPLEHRRIFLSLVVLFRYLKNDATEYLQAFPE